MFDELHQNLGAKVPEQVNAGRGTVKTPAGNSFTFTLVFILHPSAASSSYSGLQGTVDDPLDRSLHLALLGD